MLAEQFDHVDVDVLAAMGADADDPAALRQRRDAVVQPWPADHVEGKVDAEPVGQRHDRLADLGLLVVDDRVGAERPRGGELVVRRRWSR